MVAYRRRSTGEVYRDGTRVRKCVRTSLLLALIQSPQFLRQATDTLRMSVKKRRPRRVVARLSSGSSRLDGGVDRRARVPQLPICRRLGTAIAVGHRLQHVTLRCITLHYITLRYITLHYVTLRYITLHFVTLRYITLHYVTLRYITLNYVKLRYITLHYVTLRYITLH